MVKGVRGEMLSFERDSELGTVGNCWELVLKDLQGHAEMEKHEIIQ